MQVKEGMSEVVLSVGTSHTLRQAAIRMARRMPPASWRPGLAQATAIR